MTAISFRASTMERIIPSFFFTKKSSEGTCSCPKTHNLRVGELEKQFITLTRVSAQRGIPARRDGTLRLLEMQQLSRTPDHTRTSVSEHLGHVFRQNPTLGDPQFVEIASTQILATQKLGQGFLLREPYRWRSSTDTSENRRL